MHRMMAAWPRAQLGQLKCILGLLLRAPSTPNGPTSPPQKFVYIAVHTISGLFRHRQRRLVPTSKNIVRARKKLSMREGHSSMHSAARKRMYVWHHDMTCGIMVQSSAAFGVMRRALRAITELEARFARIHRVRRLRCYVVSTLFAHSTRGLYLQIVPPLIDILDENRKQVPAYDGWIGSTRAFSEHATIGISDTMKKTAGVSIFRSRNDAHRLFLFSH